MVITSLNNHGSRPKLASAPISVSARRIAPAITSSVRTGILALMAAIVTAQQIEESRDLGEERNDLRASPILRIRKKLHRARR